MICDGEKHYLLREPEIRIGLQPMHDSHAEASAIATVLAEHIGWKVSRSSIAIEGDGKPPSENNEEELLAALRSRRLLAELDEKMRLTIRPPKLGQRIGGLVLLAMGGGWLWIMAGTVNFFINDAHAKQRPLMKIPFWLLMAPLLMVGVGLGVLGVVVLLGRERWPNFPNSLKKHCNFWGFCSKVSTTFCVGLFWTAV